MITITIMANVLSKVPYRITITIGNLRVKNIHETVLESP